MKPRIRKHGSWWLCTQGFFGFLGETPKDAYTRWAKAQPDLHQAKQWAVMREQMARRAQR